MLKHGRIVNSVGKAVELIAHLVADKAVQNVYIKPRKVAYCGDAGAFKLVGGRSADREQLAHGKPLELLGHL
jgi:hypothetical protein